MDKVVSIEKAIQITNHLNNQRKRIVLTGGCFDILHIGHISFLENAKKEGDVLFVLLESDESIKKLKGDNRPINNQEDRAKILESLKIVDYIIRLPYFENDKDYDKLISSLKPDIIATTK